MNLPQFERFSVHEDPTNVGIRWEKYIKRLENFFTAFNVTDDAQKRALLLHIYSGPEVSDIFDNLSNTGTDSIRQQRKLWRNTSALLWMSNTSVLYFDNANKSMKLSTRQYHYRLQHLASTCKFSLFRSWSRSQITNHSWVHITQAAQVCTAGWTDTSKAIAHCPIVWAGGSPCRSHGKRLSVSWYRRPSCRVLSTKFS